MSISSSESAQSEEHNHSFSMLYVSLSETEKLKIEASKFSRSAHVLATTYIFLFPASHLGKRLIFSYHSGLVWGGKTKEVKESLLSGMELGSSEVVQI